MHYVFLKNNTKCSSRWMDRK